jgi:hypothetical protein
MEKPHLVLGSTGRHIESLTCRLRCKGTNSFIWCRNHAEKNYVPLIALKRVSVTADQPAFTYYLGLQFPKDLVFNQLGLGVTLQANHAHCATGISWISNTRDDLRHQSIRFWLVQGILGTAFSVSIRYMSHYQRLQTIRWI